MGQCKLSPPSATGSFLKEVFRGDLTRAHTILKLKVHIMGFHLEQSWFGKSHLISAKHLIMTNSSSQLSP